MNSNDVIKFAAAYAAGALTFDGLLEAFGGDNPLTEKVVALVGSVGVAGISAHLVDGSVDTLRELPIAGEVLEVSDSAIDAAVDVASDVADLLNPFNW